MKVRWGVHIGELRNHTHHNKALLEDFISDGLEGFDFVVIATGLSKKGAFAEERRMCEQTEHFCYNYTYLKTGVDHFAYNMPWSQEQRDAVAARNLGTTRNDETKAKMRKTAIERSKWISLKQSIEEKKTPIKDNLGNTFQSLTEAAEFHNIKVMTACDIIKGRHTFTENGVTLKNVDDDTPWPVNPKTVYCSNGKSYPSTMAAAADTGESLERVRYCIAPKKTKFADGTLTFWKEGKK